MILTHRGEFAASEEPLAKAWSAAARWLRDQPGPRSRRNQLMVKLCQLRLARQRGATDTAHQLAHSALADFRALPASMQTDLNGTVWLESEITEWMNSRPLRQYKAGE